jgi:hypothetical protein
VAPSSKAYGLEQSSAHIVRNILAAHLAAEYRLPMQADGAARANSERAGPLRNLSRLTACAVRADRSDIGTLIHGNQRYPWAKKGAKYSMWAETRGASRYSVMTASVKVTVVIRPLSENSQ